ncbi:hypothetical protein ACFWBV_31700 [Streptomyces sp. NPDC060030]|uniref:hypothetical protein n=1 Tax=Streptomyces sp. NPDC060030 TaxID=3347042 RepID=UPI0036AEC191
MAEIRDFWNSDPTLGDRINEVTEELSMTFRDGTRSTSPTGHNRILELIQLSAQVIGDVNYSKPLHDLVRESEKSKRFSKQVRRFRNASGGFFESSRLHYINGSVKGGVREARLTNGVKGYRENLYENILAGPQIIPGLALRGVLEISRIAAQGENDALISRLYDMPDDDLIDVLVKDLFRP